MFTCLLSVVVVIQSKGNTLWKQERFGFITISTSPLSQLNIFSDLLSDGENRNAVRAGIISTLFLLPIVVMVVLVVRSRRTRKLKYKRAFLFSTFR